jgi:TPR repeat protein
MKINLIPILLLAAACIGVAADPDLKAKAEAGDANAQYEVGSQLLRTKGYDKDELLNWWKQSADNGYWEAQVRMGIYYSDAKKHELAKKYTRMAAEQGSIDGMNNLAYMERGGTGLPANNIEALKWYRIAEMLGMQKSVNVEYVKKQLGSNEIQHAEIEANNWIKEHPNITKK